MERVLTVFTATLYVILRLWRLTQFNLQRDEIFSLETARLGWRALFGAVTADVVHPPLFYIILKLWMLVGGESLFWLRLLPTLIAIATLIPFLLLCRELGLGGTVCNLALFLFAVNRYFIDYAHALRMYSLLLCVALVAMWRFVRLWNKARIDRRELLVLFVAHLFLVYSHYYGWLLVAAELLFVLIWKRERARIFTGLVGLLTLCFAPWLLAIWSALQTRTVGLSAQLSWHFKPTLVDIAAYFALLNGAFAFPRSTTIGILIFGGVIILTLIAIWRRRSRETLKPGLKFLLVVSFIPPILAFVVSWCTPNSIWHSRYLIISGAPYLMLIAYSLMQLRPRWLKLSLLAVVLVWATLAGAEGFARNDTRIEWDVLAKHVSDNEPAAGPVTRVYAFDELPRYPMGFYLRRSSGQRFLITQITPAELSQLSENRFWVVYSEATWPVQLSPQRVLEQNGYRIGPTISSGPGRRGYTLFVATRNH